MVLNWFGRNMLWHRDECRVNEVSASQVCATVWKREQLETKGYNMLRTTARRSCK